MRAITVVFGLLFASALGAPAFASTTVLGSANPIVSWNASMTGTLTLYPNYNAASGQTAASGIGSVVAATNGGFTGASGCTPAPAQASNVINYANVSVPAGANTTACDYKNALSVGVLTNDSTSWNVTQQLQLAPGNGFTLCAILNGALYTGTPSAGSPMSASTATAASASINETSCGGAQQTLGTNSVTPALNTVIPTQSGAIGSFYQGEDVLLLLTSNTLAIGTYGATMTVTLTLN